MGRCTVDKLEKKRNIEVTEIVAIIRVLFIFMVFTSLYSFLSIRPDDAVTGVLLTVIVVMLFVIIIYTAWGYFVRTSEQTLQVKKYDVIYMIGEIFLLTIVIYFTGAHKSMYKNLYFVSIITTSIRFGSKMGILSSGLSAAGLIFNDMILQLDLRINSYLEADLIIIITFFITGWMLGTFMENEIKYRNQLSRKANIDEVTELYNHRYFQERLAIEIENAKLKDHSLALIIIDLDYFKFYNDTFGHQQGDILLKSVGKIITKSIRDEDVVCRYGGDEFAVILQNTSPDEARSIGERIRLAIDGKKFFGEESQPGNDITVSVGVAMYPDNAADKDELIKKADDAMYKAKFMSKNRVELYFSVLDDLKASLNESEKDLLNSIRTLITVINAKDKYTYGHSERVVLYTTMIGQAMGLNEEEIKNLRYSAYLHDIGKIEISRDILNKDSKLTDEEWEILKSHPAWGADIIKPIAALSESVPAILHHHERFDGKGYPGGLKGYNIPFHARILTVADSFDAMVTERPYKAAMSFQAAIEELKKCSGTQFDPIIVNHFIAALLSNKDSIAM